MGNDILHGSLFGYSKKDVNSYIADLSNQYKIKSEEYDEKLLEISNENSTLKQNIDSLNDEVSNFKKEFALLQAENESIKNDCTFLKEQINELEIKKNELLQMLDNLAIENKSNEIEKGHFERLYNEAKVINTLKQKVLDENNQKLEEMTIEAYTIKQQLFDKDNHIKDLTGQIEDLVQNLQKSKDEYVILLQEKEISDEKYAQIENEISDIIERAQKNAEEIIQDAKDKANEIIDNANTESDVIVTKANNESDRVKSVYKDAAREYYAELIQYTEEMKYTLSAFMKEVSAKSKDFNDKIDFMRLETENKARTTGIIEEKVPVQEVQKQIKVEPDNVKKSDVVNKLEIRLEELLKKAKDTINNITKRRN